MSEPEVVHPAILPPAEVDLLRRNADEEVHATLGELLYLPEENQNYFRERLIFIESYETFKSVFAKQTESESGFMGPDDIEPKNTRLVFLADRNSQEKQGGTVLHDTKSYVLWYDFDTGDINILYWLVTEVSGSSEHLAASCRFMSIGEFNQRDGGTDYRIKSIDKTIVSSITRTGLLMGLYGPYPVEAENNTYLQVVNSNSEIDISSDSTGFKGLEEYEIEEIQAMNELLDSATEAMTGRRLIAGTPLEKSIASRVN